MLVNEVIYAYNTLLQPAILIYACYWTIYNTQGVSYSQKFHSKRNFPKLANNGTSQFRFYEYLIEYQNVKNWDQNLKIRKVGKTNIKTMVL